MTAALFSRVLGMVHTNEFSDVLTTNWTSVSPIEEHLRTIVAGDHVVTRTEKTVPHAVHTDGTFWVPIVVNALFLLLILRNIALV